jgi:hypothetical protein
VEAVASDSTQLELFQMGMPKRTLGIYELNQLRNALDDILGYLTDNSCGDPDCCGGPYYSSSYFDSGAEVLRNFGLEAVSY